MTATRLRPIGHEDRLSLVDHLDELRKRLIVCVIAFGICFGISFWQNDAVLGVLDPPFQAAAFKQDGGTLDPFEQATRWQERQRRAWLQMAAIARLQAREESDPELSRLFAQAADSMRSAADATPSGSPRRPVTLGVGEPFTVTLKVAAYAGLLLSLPIILYQLYAFVLPAFSPRERRVALPLMLTIPVLFIVGVVFAYAVVLPRALDFLQNFNDDNFDIMLQAQDYYRFSILLLMVMGLLFQIPIGILAATRMGIISVAQLRHNRRYAILVIAVLAMLLPGTEPVTMILAMLPLVLLYEGSIIFASLLERRASRARDEDVDHDSDEMAVDDDPVSALSHPDHQGRD